MTHHSILCCIFGDLSKLTKFLFIALEMRDNFFVPHLIILDGQHMKLLYIKYFLNGKIISRGNNCVDFRVCLTRSSRD